MGIGQGWIANLQHASIALNQRLRTITVKTIAALVIIRTISASRLSNQEKLRDLGLILSLVQHTRKKQGIWSQSCTDPHRVQTLALATSHQPTETTSTSQRHQLIRQIYNSLSPSLVLDYKPRSSISSVSSPSSFVLEARCGLWRHGFLPLTNGTRIVGSMVSIGMTDSMKI